MAYLFDTDAISELLRPRPAPAYVEWLRGIPRERQFTSAVVIGELYRGAFRSPSRERHLVNIRQRVLPAVTVLPYDVAIAEVCGLLSAQLEETGQALADADLQIAATAVYHNLELVSGNLRHFGRISQLRCNPILTKSRREKGGHP
jgi:predicted nucleic acid-binding protein